MVSCNINTQDAYRIDAYTSEMVPFIALITANHRGALISCAAYAVESDFFLSDLALSDGVRGKHLLHLFFLNCGCLRGLSLSCSSLFRLESLDNGSAAIAGSCSILEGGFLLSNRVAHHNVIIHKVVMVVG